MNRIILEKQDMTYLEWSKIKNSSGTAGSFLKAYEEIAGKRVYYKLSDYDTFKGIIGHESVNEIIVDRLLELLGIEHLNYRLIHADVKIDSNIIDTFVCVSDSFRNDGDTKIALDKYYQAEKNSDESLLDFCIRNKWETYIYQMLIVDFLILNRDRHGANIEVLRNSKNKTIRLAPLFDHGLSLLCSCKSEDLINQFDVMEDKNVQCCVGSKSAYDNLNLIPYDKLPILNRLKETDKDFIFKDLETVIDKKLIEKIWNMIWLRWNYYEDFCNKRSK